jgi:outer membrane biosynthesis protein TonB
MKTVFVIIFWALSLSTVSANETIISQCSNFIEPLSPVKVIYPGLPAGGYKDVNGWVTLDFDILKNGSTAKIKVIESSSRILEKPAIRTVLNIKYPSVQSRCQKVYKVQFGESGT